MPVFPFQDSAAIVMAGADRLGLHDEMGIGKTATTIRAINYALGDRNVIVVPAMLRDNWMREIKRFTNYDLRPVKARSVHDFIAWKRGRFNTLICSYEHATKWRPLFKEHGEYFDTFSLDEAHYLKNVSSQRTRAILGKDARGEDSVSEYAGIGWHITGTPLSNDPMDVYTFLQWCHAIDMQAKDFMKAFFHTRTTVYGTRNTIKDDMLTTLQALIRNNSIRRTHADVGMQLPQIWMKQVIIEGDTSEIAEAVKLYPHLEALIVYAIEQNDFSLLNAAHIATVRRLVGKAKAAAYAPLLEDELRAGADKRVAFFVHTEPLLFTHNYLKKYGWHGVIVYGDSSERERIAAVDEFMTNPSCAYILGNMRVAGVGLTLTASSEIDVVESDWTPSANAQAIKRVHRYGQTKDVHARFITLANTIDEPVNRVVAEKTAAIAQIEGFTMAAAPLDVLTANQ